MVWRERTRQEQFAEGMVGWASTGGKVAGRVYCKDKKAFLTTPSTRFSLPSTRESGHSSHGTFCCNRADWVTSSRAVTHVLEMRWMACGGHAPNKGLINKNDA